MKPGNNRKKPRRISVKVSWSNGDVAATAFLPPAHWQKVGDGLRVDATAWSWYEGKRERVQFRFNFPGPGELAVTSAEAEYFLGNIEDALIEGATYPARPRDVTEFEVSESGTLSMVGVEIPDTRAEVYGLTPRELRNADDLIQAANDCPPLTWQLHREYQEARDRLERELVDAGSIAFPVRKTRLLAASLAAMPDDPEEGALEWLASLSKKKLVPIIRGVREWLKQAPDWTEEDDYIPQIATGRGAAMAYFQAWPIADLDALGIDIVEGDHPGSTYFAAELRGDIVTANREAIKRGLKVWFVSENLNDSTND